jgi:poly(A)-specific ribonuclease
MNILRSHFKESLESIVRDIKASQFIAFDFEFTGLGAAQYEIDLLDTVEERYEKLRRSVEKYIPIQLGICCFNYDEATKTYVAKPFNFYSTDTLIQCFRGHK